MSLRSRLNPDSSDPAQSPTPILDRTTSSGANQQDFAGSGFVADENGKAQEPEQIQDERRAWMEAHEDDIKILESRAKALSDLVKYSGSLTNRHRVMYEDVVAALDRGLLTYNRQKKTLVLRKDFPLNKLKNFFEEWFPKMEIEQSEYMHPSNLRRLLERLVPSLKGI